MSAIRIIDDRPGLEGLVDELRAADRIGLDVEGDGLYRYRSRLCLIQVARGADEAVIDPLAIEDLSPLAELLGPDGPEKVVHDVSFDFKMLATRGLALGRVFDTSVAARFLSEPSTGLAALLEKHLEVTIDKSLQQADWGERPLTGEQLEYVVGDVRHLAELRARFHERLAEADLLEEAHEETRYAMARALEPEAVREPWSRVKGARELEGRKLALLRALADAREREAERRDVPPFRVASNRVLFEAARRGARRVKDLRRVRGLRRVDDAVLREALEAAERDGPPSAPAEAPPPASERAERKAREKALTAWRKAEAEARGVDVQAVLPGHCLRDLARATPDEAGLRSVAGLGDKRVARYGATLIELLAAADGSS